jgi:hypothetical protein
VCFRQRKSLAVLLSLLCIAPAFTQDYRTENEGRRFVQRLAWDDDPNVFKYEVTIERETGGIVEQRITTDNHIEVSLPPGRYKYTVDVYNLLDLLDYRMPVVSFEVLEALQPVVTGWTPNVFSLTGGNNEVTFSGENLVRDSQIILVKKGSQDERTVSAETFGSGDGSSVLVRLPMEEIEKGTWTVYVTNPGGLRTVVPGFIVRHNDRINIDLSALYRPVVPIRQDNPGENNLFGWDLLSSGSFLFDLVFVNSSYQGAGLKFAWLPFRTNRVNAGFLVEPYWVDLTTRTDFFYTTPYIIGVSSSALLQVFFLDERLALHFSVGGGVLNLRDFSVVANDPDTGSSALISSFLGTGLSVKIYPIKSLFVELGLSWNITPPFDDPALQYFNPQAGIGYSF